jgi:glycosyltransferase involved in cell wall biosynthesis
MYTFIGTFTAWLDRQGIPYTGDVDAAYDVLFANSWAIEYPVVKRAKRAHPAIVVAQRVDGSAVDYGSIPDADREQARVNLLADVTIFQSEYSRYSTREKFRVVSQDGPVIYNPVDLERFRPEGATIELPGGRPRVACASWSTNRRKGTWLVDEIAAAHPDVTFVLSGRIGGVAERPNVVRLGHLDRDGMAAMMRSCDVFLNLSENDPCPNVVIEALASGLPVLYRNSGGVPELVGECGVAIEPRDFGPALRQVMAQRAELSACARRRAEARFAPAEIFPKYLDALARAVRRPEPSTLQVLRMVGAGYPLLPKLRPRSAVGRGLRRAAPARLTARRSAAAATIGWITYDSFPRRKRRFSQLDSFTGMRVGNVARWINHSQASIHNELYDPDRRYSVVVFQKMMDERCQDEAAKIQAYGGKVIFDANVNYYDIAGDYFIPGTRPTEQQQQDARRITAMADWVVADSSNLASVIAPINPKVTWIPDNVDFDTYAGIRAHAPRQQLRLIWSGVGKKAAHLLEARDAFAAVPGLELVLVTDEAPACLPDLERALPCRMIKFSDQGYARALMNADVIVSPKRLVNAYELGHTEYKIALGMAVGLPAVASPQQSYLEAIGAHGGGIVAGSTAEWIEALRTLQADAALRGRMGAFARRTVRERYSTPVIAKRYLQLLEQLAGVPS